MMWCNSCGSELERVFPDDPARRKDDNPNYKEALRIKLAGGYGEYIDGHVDMIICEKCAKILITDNPWMGTYIKQYLEFWA